jgi:diguanylate cyclase (GGDEF)-like protein
MTLFRQLFIAICALFTVLFIGLILIGINNVRGYLDVQLKSISNDTAVTLALRLSPHISQKENHAVESIVNVIFDSGYYGEISLRDTGGHPYLQRVAPVKVSAVPSWFINAIPLTSPQGSALIADGWRQMGSITVRTSPGYAYLALWNITIDILLWFGGAILLAWGATYFVLRHILEPLQVVELQASAASYRQFHMQPKLPWTREFRTVVLAMNKMVAKVRELFEVQDAQKAEIDRLWSDCYTDKLTGLANRRYFDICLQKAVESSQKTGSGSLIFIELCNLHDVNESGGYTSGDEFLQKASRLITTICEQQGCRDAFVARLSGGNFAILLSDISETAASDISAKLKLALMQDPSIAKDGKGVNVGFAIYRGQSLSEYIGEASWSLCYAQIAATAKDKRHLPVTHPFDMNKEKGK